MKLGGAAHDLGIVAVALTLDKGREGVSIDNHLQPGHLRRVDLVGGISTNLVPRTGAKSRLDACTAIRGIGIVVQASHAYIVAVESVGRFVGDLFAAENQAEIGADGSIALEIHFYHIVGHVDITADELDILLGINMQPAIAQ